MSSNNNDSGAMRAFLPGLVLGLVVGLGIGAFAMPFFDGSRAPNIAAGNGADTSRESRPRDGITTDPLGFGERDGEEMPQLSPEQIAEALEQYRERNGLGADDSTPDDSGADDAGDDPATDEEGGE